MLVDRAQHTQVTVVGLGRDERWAIGFEHGADTELGRGLAVAAGYADHQRVPLAQGSLGALFVAPVDRLLERLQGAVGDQQRPRRAGQQEHADGQHDGERGCVQAGRGEHDRGEEQQSGSEQGGGEQALGARSEDEWLDRLSTPVAHTQRRQGAAGEQEGSGQPARSVRGCRHGRREQEARGEQLAGGQQLASPAQPQHQAGTLVVLELEQVQQAMLAAGQTDGERRDREDRRDAFEGAHRSSGDGVGVGCSELEVDSRALV